MVIHNIFDFTYLYYKYKFAMASGKMRKLTCPVNWKGAVIEKDISIIYYAIREIEKQRRELEEAGHSVVSTVCFDMPSNRKEIEGGEDYKADRKSSLTQDDFDNIQFIEKLLSEAGHNTYRYDGYEADDLVTYLAQNYKDVFDYTIIYTPDKDLLVNICDKVGAKRHKTLVGYQPVNMNNYSTYLSAEFGCNIPYNAILLFLSAVGDKSDNIKGINKFGPKAFDKLINNINSKYDVDWSHCGNIEYLEKVLVMAGDFLTPEQQVQMVNSYKLVKPRELDFIPPSPSKKTTYELRQKAYEPYKFVSLYQ